MDPEQDWTFLVVRAGGPDIEIKAIFIAEFDFGLIGIGGLKLPRLIGAVAASGVIHLHDGRTDNGRVHDVIHFVRCFGRHETQIAHRCLGVIDTKIFVDAAILEALNRAISGLNDWGYVRRLAFNVNIVGVRKRHVLADEQQASCCSQ